MYFPVYSWQFMKPIEDVFLPGDEELYAPVVLRRREYGRGLLEELSRADWFNS